MPTINDQPVPHAGYGRAVLTVVAGVATVPPVANEAVVVPLTTNTTIKLGTPLAGYRKLDVVFLQDATGGRSVTWDPVVQWLTGPPTITAAPLARTAVLLVWDNGTWYENATQLVQAADAIPVVTALPAPAAGLRSQLRVLEANGQPDRLFYLARLSDGSYDWAPVG